MFKIVKPTTFFWPIPVNVPQDGGGYSTFEFQAEFKMQAQSVIDKQLADLRDDDSKDILKIVLVGWKGVQAEDGTVLDFSEENRDILLDITYVRTALIKAYFEAVSGNKVKRGN